LPVPATGLAIVELRAHQLQTAPGDAVGSPLFGGNGAAAFQFAKQNEVETRRTPAVAIDTDDAFDLAALTAFDFDPPALRKQVKKALLSARYIQFVRVR